MFSNLVSKLDSYLLSVVKNREGILFNNTIPMSSFVELIQNTTIEERVSLLEIQVVEIEEDVTGLDLDVNFLFDEQIIQDERLFSLEEETDAIDTRLLIIDNGLIL